ncbi:hypothetical protein LEP1GSC051_0274 [Leptospira sp. P2653]|nr:hypothetical protein LEP1GSC051_0274 [Leptospira sp. P2653]
MSSGSRCTLVSYSPNFYYAEFALNYKMKTRTKQISQLNLRNRFYSFQKKEIILEFSKIKNVQF